MYAGILFEEPNPTGGRPRGLIGLYRKWQRAKSRDPNQLGSIGNGKQERERGANTSKVRRARRRWWHGGSKWGEVKHREEGGGDRGSTAARPTLTRDWGGPQVRDPAPIVSVNPEADPPQPRAPVRPNRAEQAGEIVKIVY